MAVIEEMLDMLGLEGERFRLVWCSSAEADRFVGEVRGMTETLRLMGPSPYRKNAAILLEHEEVAACR